MDDYGIAWMIAGGVRTQSAEDRRQQLHRVALAQTRSADDAILVSLRRRIGAMRLTTFLEQRAIARADSARLNADCCTA